MYDSKTPVGGGIALSEQVIQIILRDLAEIKDEQRRAREAQEELKDSFNAHLQEYARQKAVLQEKDKQFISLQCEHEQHKASTNKVEGATMFAKAMWAACGGAVTFVVPYILKVVFK